MKNQGYEAVHSVSDVGRRQGCPGNLLLRVPWMLVLLLLLLCVYALAALAFITFLVLRCPSTGRLYRVLPTGDLKVDQFYSGLALSILLTPAALLARRLAYDVALLHPFALGSKMRIEVADVDVLLNPGLVATGMLFKYSVGRALVQTLIMLMGAFLVPVGTLLVFPGQYASMTHGVAAVGKPNYYGSSMSLSIELNGTNDESQASLDFFLQAAAPIYVSNVIRQAGAIPQHPGQLGPVPTSNLTYEEGVTYRDIVTFLWTSGCQYTDQIHFVEWTEQYAWMFNLTLPDGTVSNNLDAYSSEVYVMNLTDPLSAKNTTYYTIMGIKDNTANFDNVTAGPNPPIVVMSDGAWISRVSCSPTLNWQVSSCTWRNGSMTDCEEETNANTTALDVDVDGLEMLKHYINNIPLYVFDTASYAFDHPVGALPLIFDPHLTYENRTYLAPTLEDYDKMYGLVAEAIVTVATGGYYGVSEVPTTGSSPRPVYLVRMHILAVVVVILVLCPLATASVLFWNLFVHRIPLRPATFLTTANAVRGTWWDSVLWGTCLMSPSDLQRAVRGLKVMFGATIEDDKIFEPSCHVGFAERVAPVKNEDQYFGIKKPKLE